MELKAQLDESGLVLEGGALVDATLEESPGRRPPTSP